MFYILIFQMIANHQMPGISFASGGDSVSFMLNISLCIICGYYIELKVHVVCVTIFYDFDGSYITLNLNHFNPQRKLTADI